MKNILIIGATSAIASAYASRVANEGVNFFLVARNLEKLSQTADDLIVRGATAKTYALDLNSIAEHSVCIDACFAELGHVDVALIAHGTLPVQKECEDNVQLAVAEFSNNCLSTIAVLTVLANKMERQGAGTIVVISSVAGDRGRKTNYLYGSAKAGVTVFCSGLRSRLLKSGVHVVTLKPGFVDTPMTQALSLPKLLVAQADTVARYIDEAAKRKSDVVYAPFFWRLIMLIIRLIPETIFKRMSL